MQITGPNLQADQAYGLELLRRMRDIRGIADARMQQSMRNPQLRVDVDRSLMAQLGLNELDVTNAVTTSLAGSSQTAPTYWLDPKNGVSYPIVAQTPEYQVTSLSQLENLPVTGSAGGLQVLGGLSTITRQQSNAVVTHYNVMPAIDLYATTQDRDLGGVASDIQTLIKDTAKSAPKGATVTLRGQIVTMNEALRA